MRLWTNRLNRARRGDDSGFTLIEAVIALAISALLLTAIAYASVGGIRASATARINQQAADVMETALESDRTVPLSNLTMYTGDPDLSTAKDSRLLTSGCPSGGTMCVSVPNPTGSGTVTENLETSSQPGFMPDHIQQTSTGTNKVTFTVSTYVTKPADEASATYRHVTVYVTWTAYGRQHVRVDSTYVAATQRGLPLPSFKWECNSTSTGTSCTNPQLSQALPSTEIDVGLKLTNFGYRDIFNITADQPGWTFYRDVVDPTTGLTGSFGPEDPVQANQLSDSDADKSSDTDTGTIENDSSILIWAVGTSSGVVGSVNTVNFTATSVVDSGLASSVHATPLVYTVATIIYPVPTTSPTPCQGSSSGTPTGRVFYLHDTTNGTSITSGTTSQSTAPLSFSTGIPIAGTLANYSTEVGALDNNPGRILKPGTATANPTYGVAGSAANQAVLGWTFTVTSNIRATINQGSLFWVDFFVAPDPKSGPPGGTPPKMTVVVGSKGNGGGSWTQQGTTVNPSLGGSCITTTTPMTFTMVRISVAMTSTFTLKKGSSLEVLLFNTPSGSGNNRDLRIGYDAVGCPQFLSTIPCGASVTIPSSVDLNG